MGWLHDWGCTSAIPLQLSHFLSKSPIQNYGRKKRWKGDAFLGVFPLQRAPDFPSTPNLLYSLFSLTLLSALLQLIPPTLVPAYISTAALPPGSHLLHPTTTTFHRRQKPQQQKTLINNHNTMARTKQVRYYHYLSLNYYYPCLFLLLPSALA